jgi:peptide deformylase
MIRVQYYNEHFEFMDERYDGVKARIIQHETDHLNGVLFTDRVSPMRKRLLKAKLKAISKGDADVQYKIIFPG